MTQAGCKLRLYVRQTDSRRPLTAGHDDRATVLQYLRYLGIII
jgi:hypothetical protein